MNWSELFDLDLLAEMMGNRYVGVQRHPTEDLLIYNYTHNAQYDRVWNEVTTQCRGLIVRGDGTVVARPFRKFFNSGEHEEGTLDLEAPVTVTDKLDGSLGILYPLTNPLAQHPWDIATRGSFTSEQAKIGSLMLAEKYREWVPDPACTYLFEIIYPANRIVIDYQGKSDLFLLEVLDTETGTPSNNLNAATSWPGPDVELFLHRTLSEALEHPPRPNAEGLVVHFPMTNERLKIKQDDYVQLHRLVTGLNERTVWEMLGEGKTIEEIQQPLPEEFWPWTREVGEKFVQEAARIEYDVTAAYARIMLDLPTGFTRKDFAMQVALQSSWLKPLLFMRFDRKDLAPAIWKTLRPVNPQTLVSQSEDAA